jgi:hypothetical protein
MGDKEITLILCGSLFLLISIYFTLQRLALPSGQPLTGLFQDVIRYGQGGRWSEADKRMLKLENAWKTYKYLIAMNYGEEDYSLLKNSILRIRSGVENKDQAETSSQARASLDLWRNVLKFIPEP